jgi:hypothetical protein
VLPKRDRAEQIALLAKMICTDSHLDDARFVYAGYAHVLEHTVVDFALSGFLDDNRLPPVDQGLERGPLRLLLGIRAESEVNASIGQVSAATRVCDPEFLYGRPVRNAREGCIYLNRCHSRFLGRCHNVCRQHCLPDHMACDRVLTLSAPCA